MNMEEGTFEEIAATSALVARTAKRLHKTADAISGKWIFEQAQDGNEVCIEEIDRMCDILAKGISNICYVLNPGNCSSWRWNFGTDGLAKATN